MDLPISLKTEIEQALSCYPQAKLKEIARSLSERYRQESGKGKTLLSTDPEAAVYAAVRMPATYGAVSDALQYALACFSGEIHTLLDVGSGSGAAVWAANALIPLQQVTCLEREGAMRRVGEKLMASDPVLASARWVSGDLTSAKISEKADLVMASYVVNEIAEADRPFVLDSMWDATEKMLLLIEPGTPAGFAVLKEARAYLLGKGAHLAAPCPHEGECRLPVDDWCHFTCRVQRSKLHKALKGGDAPFEDEKYCYMAFVKQKCHPADARVLRHPQIEKGQIGLQLCTKTENRALSVKKKDGEQFKAARKAKQGDSFKI